MNNKELIAALAARTGLKATEAQKVVSTLVETMAEHFQEGISVYLTDLGEFEVRKKMERIIVSPGTGQRMLVPPKLVVAFKPTSSWKDKIKKGGAE